MTVNCNGASGFPKRKRLNYKSPLYLPLAIIIAIMTLSVLAFAFIAISIILSFYSAWGIMLYDDTPIRKKWNKLCNSLKMTI